MDLATYSTSKDAAAVVTTKLGPNMYQIVSKKFDPATGRETYPEVVTITRKNIEENNTAFQAALVEAQSRVDGLALLVKDLDALDAQDVVAIAAETAKATPAP